MSRITNVQSYSTLPGGKRRVSAKYVETTQSTSNVSTLQVRVRSLTPCNSVPRRPGEYPSAPPRKKLDASSSDAKCDEQGNPALTEPAARRPRRHPPCPAG